VIIHRVHIRRFRKLSDQDLRCGPGLNIVCGRNDAGKSTLHLAFSAAFFPVRSKAEASSYTPWGAGEPGEIMVEFEADGRAYRLHKDFGARKTVLASGGDTWTDPKEIGQRIGEILGLTSLSLFRATAHIRQWDLAGVQAEGQEIGSRLSRIVTGGDGDAARVISAIDERIRKLEVGLRHPSKVPGPLKRDQDRTAALTADQHRLAGEVEAIERAAQERDRLQAQIAELEQLVRNDTALVDANRRLVALAAEWAVASARTAELQSLLERVARAAEECAAADRDEALHLPDLDRDALRALHEADTRSRLLEEASRAPAADGSDGPARASAGTGPVARFLSRLEPARAGVGAIGAGLIGLGFLAFGRTPAGISAWVVAAVLAILTALAWARKGAARQQAYDRLRRQEETAQRAQAARRAATAAADDVRRRLAALGVPSLAAAFEQVARRQEALRRQTTARRILESLLGGRTAEEMAEEHRRVLTDLGAIRAQREDPDMVLKQLDPAGFQRLRAEAAAREKRLADAREALQRLEGRLSGRLPHEDLARVEEDLAETRDRLARRQQHVEVLRLAKEVMLEAHRQTIVPGRAMLEDRAGRYLHELSGGVYDRLSVDEHTLAPRVWVGPPKEWANVVAGEIGSGAFDQCYLALRLALIDLLCQDRRPPLFLDDPFLAYDEDRAGGALRLLRQLGRERQIFLLTCRSGYGGHADHLILLGEIPAAQDGGQGGQESVAAEPEGIAVKEEVQGVQERVRPVQLSVLAGPEEAPAAGAGSPPSTARPQTRGS